MKPRHYALSALAAWLLLGGWAAYNYATQPSVRLYAMRAPAAAVPPALLRDIEAADKLAATLQSMAQADAAGAAPARNVALATDAQPGLPRAGAAPGRAGSGESARVVTMIMAGGRGARLAIVDGEYVREGQRLADGTRVTRIDMAAVTLEDAIGLQRTYPLRHAFKDNP
ncbi:hypothetical protein L535_0791 [Bordetella bronchiseptica SBL-F6116]|uniref:hypothetical protein n=1 Tax=Bordetella bronchiseptica TaxID=518 RepID=UPI00045A5FEB|nr:hypothetical protein [Bordetella bronchiseptica]KCV34414.1 hypothetical protein L489_0848 [Bordetella bronchiseptica 00-P-2730]KDD96037.1 hypothetical protein L535_0791 [Bordetella bronchiseptica SBL-F6116]